MRFRPGFLFGLVLLLLASSVALAASSLRQWMDFEQKRIDRSVDENKIMAPTIDDQKPEFRPDSGQWFDLPSVWVPEEALDRTDLTRLMAPELRSEFVRVHNGHREFRLFIHPESREFYKEYLAKYPVVVEHRATATASSRTLLVRSIAHPERESFVKVSLAVNLGGVLRVVLRQETARAIGTTAYVHAMQDRLSKRFVIFDETLGIIPKGWDQGGQIVRPIRPDVLSGDSLPVPLFSLYADNPKGVLLDELARKAGVTPEEFVDRHINRPFAEAWADWAINGSMIMEPHAQNVLLELGRDGLPTGRFLLRDLGGFNIDPTSPTFDRSLMKDLQYIKSFQEDYLQDKIKQLHNYSLNNYYEGGFLHNVENYLARTRPGYSKGSLTDRFWNQVADAIRASSGYKGFTVEELRGDVYDVLQKARAYRAARTVLPYVSELQRCQDAFRSVAPVR